MSRAVLGVAVIAAAGLASSARADVATFYFAQQGMSYSAFLPGDSELIGQQAVLARIYLTVESFPGSEAADFFTDISFPIEPDPGATSALVLTGAEMGWSGEGTFDFFLETTDFNGTFISRRYGAETFSDTFRGRILDGSRIEFVTVPGPGGMMVAGLAGVAALRRRRNR